MRSLCYGLVILAVACHFDTAHGAPGGEIEIRVVDGPGGEVIPVRMHLRDRNGRPMKLPKTIAWNDHFILPGTMVLQLKSGDYSFEMEHGPEYKLRTGTFTITNGAADSKTVEMNRFVDMKKEGWWSGDLHVHRAPDDMPLLMAAEDLHVAPVITWWNKKNVYEKGKLPPENLLIERPGERFIRLLAGEDERNGGALLFFNLAKPLEIAGAEKEFPSSAEFLKQAKAAGADVHVDAEKPFWWDFPMWVATGQIDTVGICHNHLQRDGMLTNEAWGRPRPANSFRGDTGIGRYTLDIYYHVLNCGLRLPPSAGSASGVLPNPVGYNRVYVHCGDKLDYASWFAGLKAGRSVVTNGPMMRPRVNGQLPGHVFKGDQGEKIELEIELNLGLREKVDYLEIVKDGKVLHEVRLDQFVENKGMLPIVTFDRSGWMLIRAVTNLPKTYRFAMSAPFYVEIDGEKRVSKASAQYFLDWTYDRARQIAAIEDVEQRVAILEYHKSARDFWQKIVSEANAE